MRYSHLLAGAVAAAVLTLTLCVPNVNAETTVTFKSDREGTIKVAVYKTSDVVQGIPLKTWEIDPGKSVNWDKAPSKFHVKVFKPQALDNFWRPKTKFPTTRMSRSNTGGHGRGPGRASTAGRAG